MTHHRHLTALLCFIVICFMPTFSQAASHHEVVVDKTSRTLWVLIDNSVVAKFKISLGPNPEGHKQEIGDGKTPEGSYQLTWKSDESKYYRAFHINYPNSEDARLAAQRGKHPGGNIKIHGLPNSTVFDTKDYLAFDWTEGCIAVSNEAMDQLFRLIPNGTQIFIYANLFDS